MARRRRQKRAESAYGDRGPPAQARASPRRGRSGEERERGGDGEERRRDDAEDGRDGPGRGVRARDGRRRGRRELGDGRGHRAIYVGCARARVGGMVTLGGAGKNRRVHRPMQSVRGRSGRKGQVRSAPVPRAELRIPRRGGRTDEGGAALAAQRGLDGAREEVAEAGRDERVRALDAVGAGHVGGDRGHGAAVDHVRHERLEVRERERARVGLDVVERLGDAERAAVVRAAGRGSAWESPGRTQRIAQHAGGKTMDYGRAWGGGRGGAQAGRERSLGEAEDLADGRVDLLDDRGELAGGHAAEAGVAEVGRAARGHVRDEGGDGVVRAR